MTKYIKCPCRHCGGTIEFPAHGLGLTVACPHCQQKTALFAVPRPLAEDSPGESDQPPPAALAQGRPSEPSNARRSGPVWIGLALVVLVATGSALLLRKPGSTQPASAQHEPGGPSSNPAPAMPTAQASPAGPAQSTPLTPSLPPKSVDDLKVGPVTLERVKGSSLVYATGTLRNDSPHRRFGVTLELELSDRGGNNVGLAKDYRVDLEPQQEWHFRALVLDAKAVAAKVSSIREDE